MESIVISTAEEVADGEEASSRNDGHGNKAALETSSSPAEMSQISSKVTTMAPPLPQPSKTTTIIPPPQPSSSSAAVTTISTSPYKHQTKIHQTKLLHQKQLQSLQSEQHARQISIHSKSFLFLWNIYSAIAVFVTMLITIESLLGMALTVGATLIVHYSVPYDSTSSSSSNYEWNGQLPSVLLSFAVITPLSSSISMAFTRREAALRSLANYKSAVYNLYVAHASWDWGECNKGKGRRGCVENLEDMKEAACCENSTTGANHHDESINTTAKTPSQQPPPINWLTHSDTLLTHLTTLSDSLHQYLTLPNATRARHRVTTKGSIEAKTILITAQSLFTLNISARMILISQLTEALKYRGLPGNEASRIRQWENFMTTSMEELRIVKEYRTPQALRSFGRLFTLVLPPLYAPSYVQVARDTDSLALGIVLGIVTSLALTGLFECLAHLEDPFVAHVTLDGIDVREELVVLSYGELMMARDMLFPGVGVFEMDVDYDDDVVGGGSVRGKTEGGVDLSCGMDRTSRHF